MARTEAGTARNGTVLLPASAIQPRIEGKGTTGQIDRRAEAQSADETLEVFGALLAKAQGAIFGDQDGDTRGEKEQQRDDQRGGSRFHRSSLPVGWAEAARPTTPRWWASLLQDRKSTRLNSSHVEISY